MPEERDVKNSSGPLRQTSGPESYEITPPSLLTRHRGCVDQFTRQEHDNKSRLLLFAASQIQSLAVQTEVFLLLYLPSLAAPALTDAVIMSHTEFQIKRKRAPFFLPPCPSTGEMRWESSGEAFMLFFWISPRLGSVSRRRALFCVAI